MHKQQPQNFGRNGPFDIAHIKKKQKKHKRLGHFDSIRFIKTRFIFF